MNPERETVMIIDDDPGIRRSLSLFLTAMGFTVESFASSEEYLDREPYEGTGCIILDLTLEGKDGLELQEELIQEDTWLPIIFITGNASIHASVKALKKGAVNFLEKPFPDDELLNSVREAIGLSHALKAEKAETRRAKALMNSLSPREHEILELVLTGMLNKQVAYQLRISEQTVKLHRQNICKKLGVKSLPEILRIADKALNHSTDQAS